MSSGELASIQSHIIQYSNESTKFWAGFKLGTNCSFLKISTKIGANNCNYMLLFFFLYNRS